MSVTMEQLKTTATALGSTQIAILWGLINAGLIEADRMRDWLQSVINALKDDESQQTFVVCLQVVVDSLERGALAQPSFFQKLH
jgi:hypothetical protein